MNWTDLLSAKRHAGKSADDPRSAFQRDVDRIIFSDPFRRLVRKTQVHPLNENDHVHSRLTHSLETASVGHGLGLRIGMRLQDQGELPKSVEPHHLGQVVQAACLAHDIGNPPFGHSGETAIKHWFLDNLECIEHLHVDQQSDFTKFDGNAMSVRILLSTGFYGEGMQPTHAVAGALLKYPWPSSRDVGKDKFSFFCSEKETVEAIARDLGLPFREGRFSRHPLAWLMEAADDICYRIIDMEDATEVGILNERFLFDTFIPIIREKSSYPKYYDKFEGKHYRQKNGVVRAKLIKLLAQEIEETFFLNYQAIMDGDLDHKASLMELSQGPMCRLVLDTYASLKKKLFLSSRKALLEIGAQKSLGALLDASVREAKHFCSGKHSFERDKIKIIFGDAQIDAIIKSGENCNYRVIMAMLDYLTGMTDHYATDTYRKFMGLGFSG